MQETTGSLFDSLVRQVIRPLIAELESELALPISLTAKLVDHACGATCVQFPSTSLLPGKPGDCEARVLFRGFEKPRTFRVQAIMGGLPQSESTGFSGFYLSGNLSYTDGTVPFCPNAKTFTYNVWKWDKEFQ